MDKTIQSAVEAAMKAEEGIVRYGDEPLEDMIRRVVREEIAAHEERPEDKQPIFLSESHQRLSQLGILKPL